MDHLQSSLLLMALGWGLWKQVRPQGGSAHIFLVAAILLGLWLSALYLVADHFTGKGIDEATVFHLREAINPIVIVQFWEIALLAALLLGLSLWLIARSVQRSRVKAVLGWKGWFACFSVFVGLWINPAVADIRYMGYFMYQNRGPNLLGFDLEAQEDGVKPVRPRSFIYIYLEGMDRAFFEEDKFLGLMPELNKIMKEGVSIRGLKQAPLTGWTMAGLVSSQCGLPLARAATTPTNLLRNGKVFCVGDILKEHGYHLSFMGGADLTFAGKGDFYRLHGFDEVFGGPELDALAGRNLNRSKWGVYDDDLLELAYEKIQDLSENKEKFGLFLLTVDTHPPHGHESAACRGLRYGSGESGVLNAALCTDRLVSRFIQRILENERLRDVTIIVSSDHLMMANDAGLPTDEVGRTNTFFFLNAAVEDLPSIERGASILDVAPTMLHLIGFEATTLGFGRNLYRPEPTLSEKYGQEEFFRLIHVWKNDLLERLGRG